MSDAEAPLVFETPGGLSVMYRGRLLYSGRDPARLPRRVAEACDRGPERLYLVPSPLLWYGLRELLDAMAPGSAALCVETDHLLADLARSRLPPELEGDRRLFFLEPSSPGAAPEEAIAAARSLGSFRFCSIAALSGGDGLDGPAYKAIAAALTAEFEASWRNRAALMVLGHRWARNLFDNIAALPRIAPESLPRFPCAVAVCGAGPSLEEALPLIARRRRSLGVIACDTALGSLLASGIAPDLVVCLEGQAHNLADFTPLGSRPIPLAADLCSHPAAFRAVRGRKFLTFARITRSPFLDRVEAFLRAAEIPFLAMPPLGSVGVHAAYLARGLADGPVLAAGLDFSFEPGKTHARGCPSLLGEERHLSRLTRWPGQYEASFRERTMRVGIAEEGRARLSDPILLSYASLLAQAAIGPYDLRSGGPSIGGRRVGIAQAESILAATEGSPAAGVASSAVDASAAFDARGAAEASRAFLRAEGGRLEELRLAMRGGRPLAEEGLRRLVAESDYLWWGFPDQDRAGELAQDFLNRLVPQIEYWSYRLRELEASLA